MNTLVAIGEQLPFPGAVFDIILNDNVIDHAERPVAILEEIARVLKPGGILYFTVNVHHFLYDAASRAHGAWNAVGIPWELSPFADHTVHFTERRIRNELGKLPLRILETRSTVADVRTAGRRAGARNPGQLAKRLFFKNATFEAIAERTLSAELS